MHSLVLPSHLLVRACSRHSPQLSASPSKETPSTCPLFWTVDFQFSINASSVRCSRFLAMGALWEALLVMFVAIFSKTMGATKASLKFSGPSNSGYCLSWRTAVEANNVRWRTVPEECLSYIEKYMIGGQYTRDIEMIMEQIEVYLLGVIPAVDGMDAWIFDVDDTCLSNLVYYRVKRYGGDPYDPVMFKLWIQQRSCPAIPAVLRLFRKLIDGGFTVIILSGRDEETMGPQTLENLHNQGFIGYKRAIFRGPAYKGQLALKFKAQIRRQLVAEGYRIRGNIGDQWSDLLGDSAGDRTFKIPNPMYFVP